MIAGDSEHAARADRAAEPAKRDRFIAVVLALTAVSWFAARAYMVGLYASDIPSWDDWDGFGRGILIPFHEGTLGVQQFFAAHNEHRIAFSRVWSLGIYLANDRQWDNGVQAIANVLPAVASWLVALVLALRGVASNLGRAMLVALATLAVVAPYGWENAFYGLQSAFYWSTLFALLTFVGVEHAARSRLALAGALVASTASLVTVASGVLVPAVAAVAVGLAWRSGRLARNRALVGLAGFVVIAGAGATVAVHVPAHDALRATGLLHYLAAVHTLIAWPGPAVVVPALLWWSPALVLTPRLVRASAASKPATRILWLVAGWALANLLVLGHVRGTELQVAASSRYTDLITLGIFASLALGWAHAGIAHGAKRAIVAALSSASVAFGAGLVVHAMASTMGVIEFRENSDIAQRAAAAAYVRTGQRETLSQVRGHAIYPDLDVLARALDHPAIRSSLPYSIAEPLRLDPSTRAWTSDVPRLALHLRDAPPDGIGTAHFPVGDAEISGAAGPGDGVAASFPNLGGPFRIELHDASIAPLIANGPARIGAWSWRVRRAHGSMLPLAAIAGLLAIALVALPRFARARASTQNGA